MGTEHAHKTPVPGGVGPMTIASLLVNTVKLAESHHETIVEMTLTPDWKFILMYFEQFFDAYDLNRDGVLDATEIVPLMVHLDKSTAERVNIFDLFPDFGPGFTVTKAEFYHALQVCAGKLCSKDAPF